MAVLFVFIRQSVWRFLFYLDRHTQKNKRLEPLKQIIKPAFLYFSQDLAVNPGQVKDTEKQVALPKGTRAEVYAICNGAAKVHRTIQYFYLPFNPFWKRRVFFEQGVTLEELNKSSYVYMGNHTSYSDFVFASGLGITMVAAGKSDLLDMPLAGKVMRNTGLLPVHFKKKKNGKWGTDPEKTKVMLQKATEYLRCGLSIFAFPEGQIGMRPSGAPEAFKLGFFNVADEAGVGIVPLALHGAAEAWPMAKKHVPRFPMSSAEVYVKIGKPMKFLQVESMRNLSTVEEVYEFIENTYGLDLKNEALDTEEEIEASVKEIVELNLAEEAQNETEEYGFLIRKLFSLITRQKIYKMKVELEEQKKADAKVALK